MRDKKYDLGMTIVYVLFTSLLFWQSPIKEYSDSFLYYNLSNLPLSHPDFWAGNRQFTPLLLFKVFNNNLLPIAYSQLLMSWLGWLFLASMTRRMLPQASLKRLGFSLILLYSLSAEVFLWHNVLYTESLSISLFALLCGTIIWALSRLPRAPSLKQQIGVGLSLLGIAFLWAFTRDTNAYSVLGLSLMFGAFVVLVPSLRRLYLPLAGLLVLGSLLIFWGGDYSANRGGRWHYPLVNVITYRILPDDKARNFFVEHGMPYNSAVAAMTDQDPVVDWSPLQGWLEGEGKRTYMRFMLSDPLARVGEVLQHWGEVFNDDMYHWSGEAAPPNWQAFLSFIVYPKGFWLLSLVAMGLVGALLSFKQHSPYWLLCAMLLLLVIPQAFLNWHGDTLDMDRHMLVVTSLAHIGLWLLWLNLLAAWLKKAPPLSRQGLLIPLILIVGFCLEASLQNNFLMNYVGTPIIHSLFPNNNVLRNWGVPDAKYALYQEISSHSRVLNPRIIRPSTSSASVELFIFDSLLDETSLHRAYRQQQVMIENWQRTALPGYLNPFAVDYLYFDNRWWDRLSDFQRSTLQDLQFYQPIAIWTDAQTNRSYSLYRIASRQDHWNDQSQSAVTQRGLSDDAYTRFQARRRTYNLIPEGAIVFNPERGLEDRLSILTRLGRFVSSQPQNNYLDLMLTLELVQHADDLDLSEAESRSLATWRASKLPQDLHEAGIDYLFFSSLWWSLLSEAEAALIADPQQYELVEEWQLEAVFYRLYRPIPK